MDTTIFLNKYKSKKSVNTNSSLKVTLDGKRKFLPFDDTSYTISAADQYNKERESCNTIRLTCQVNAVCSNVLFNKITEIVKDEGSGDVSILNYGFNCGSSKFNVYGKSYTAFTANTSGTTNAIRDTQLSNKNNNFVYHCGLDIFNNHLIRSKTFKPVCKSSGATSNNFNTLADYMRDVNGGQVHETIYFPIGIDTKDVKRHLYEYDDVYSYKDAVANKLLGGHDGWYGFVNSSKIKSYNEFKTDKETSLNIERPIMNMNGGDFVDMYPDRSLYSFVPKWNGFQNRIEKNWNYCITYPSSSTTKGFDSIIEENNNSLKAIYFDENTRSDNGSSQIVIYSRSKHGLTVGDYVNIYKTYNSGGKRVTEKIIDNGEVKYIADDYIFTVFGSNVKISKSWVSLSSLDGNLGSFVSDGKTFILDETTQRYYTNGGKRYYIVNITETNPGYVNIDKDAQEISYKKVVNDIECDYYVRIFSKLPNFKFASGTTSEYDLYKEGSTMIKEYQKTEYEFDNQLSKLAFAKNIYSDGIAEIVFTDDINIGNLRDNRGRPLTQIYLTIIKNNKGYKEWYGFDDDGWDREHVVTEDNYKNIEFSHCFGKVNCGFEFSDECNCEKLNGDIKCLENVTNTISGFTLYYKSETDEIIYENDSDFYGDLVYYDNYNAIERTIQPILHRVNTAQRESIKSSSHSFFQKITYDEIIKDDYDNQDYAIKFDNTINNGINNNKEGYFYAPHYEIPIKTFGTLKAIMPSFLTMRSLVRVNDLFRVTVLQDHFLSVGDKTMLCDREENKYYYLITKNVINSNVFECEIRDENDTIVFIYDLFASVNKMSRYKLFKLDNLNAPSYAHVLKDGTCRIIWRDVINNGMNPSDDSIEVYPFTNGAFYVNKRINLYLKRQDPQGIYGLYNEDDILGETLEIEGENNYVKEDEIEC